MSFYDDSIESDDAAYNRIRDTITNLLASSDMRLPSPQPPPFLRQLQATSTEPTIRTVTRVLTPHPSFDDALYGPLVDVTNVPTTTRSEPRQV